MILTLLRYLLSKKHYTYYYITVSIYYIIYHIRCKIFFRKNLKILFIGLKNFRSRHKENFCNSRCFKDNFSAAGKSVPLAEKYILN